MTSGKQSLHRRLRALERALLSIAMVGLGWYTGMRVGAMLDQETDERVFEQVRAAQGSPLHIDAGAGLTRPAGVRSSAEGARLARPRELVGRIEVPRLGLSAVVREGTDAQTLRRAVGHISGTAIPGSGGNVVFAGHRDTFFRPLKDVRQGDRIRVTTPDGVFAYIVRETWIASPTDISVLDPTGKDTLTLVTCYPFSYIGPAPKRFIVRATRNPEIVNGEW